MFQKWRIPLRGTIFSRSEYIYLVLPINTDGARGGAVGWGTALQAGKSRVRLPMVSLEFFVEHNPSGRTMALGPTQPLTQMSTRNTSWGGGTLKPVSVSTVAVQKQQVLYILRGTP